MSTTTSTTHATVKRALLKNKTMSEGLFALDTLCSAGAQSPAVQGSTIASQLLVTLHAAVTAAHASLSNKLGLAQSLMGAAEILKTDFAEVRVALASYETAVDVLAAGDASVIAQAGCQARGQKAGPAALGSVSGVTSKPGKQTTEAILRWPPVAGATGYAIELSFSPQGAGASWTAIPSGSSRRRVVKGPAPGAQLLARVAALASDGTQSAWSNEVMVTVL
ncbi:MAG: hypothetical protein ABI193_07345 [Minicystis sp.]